MMQNQAIKYVEANIPEGLHLKVHHLHTGKISKTKLKRLGHHNTEDVTLARLYDEAGILVGEGKATCSERDNPRRSTGRAVAVGRALAEYCQ